MRSKEHLERALEHVEQLWNLHERMGYNPKDQHMFNELIINALLEIKLILIEVKK